MTQSLPESTARAAELDKCVNCGLCQSVCPTYLTDGNEGLTARGKIILMKGMLRGDVVPSPSIAALFDDCLTCYACQTVCPAGVKTERLWTAARQDLAAFSETTPKKRRGIRWTVCKPRLFRMLSGIGAALWGVDDELVGTGNKRYPLSRRAPYLYSLNSEYPAKGERIGKIALHVGCSGNLMAPGVVDAAINLLTYAGYEVIVPKEQVCCGAPAINNGDWKTARKLARRNVRLYSSLDADWIVSPDGTCATTLGRDYSELLSGDDRAADAATMGKKVTDISILLASIRAAANLNFKQQRTSVTIHDSCHITHIGGGNVWRQALSLVPGLEIREMADSKHCCGFGGSYSMYHSETARKIAARKLSRAAETGATSMLVGSPGCLIHLRSVAAESDLTRLKIKHHTEFLSDALAGR